MGNNALGTTMRHLDCRMMAQSVGSRPGPFIVQILAGRTAAIMGYVYVIEVWPCGGPQYLLVQRTRELRALVEL